tara:strand:- start:2276 stop:2815 length:540 start_codon:yes stop_codon:yes gene_type:complete
MYILLCGLQSPINVGMILRSAEVYGHTVAINDPFGLFDDAEKLRTISDFACGALQRRPPRVVSDPLDLVGGTTGRCVATTVLGSARQAQDFDWRGDDLVLIGNEYDGLGAALMERADSRVMIPMPPGYLPKPKSFTPIDSNSSVSHDGAPSLNTAVATSILCFLSYLRSSGTGRASSSG